MVLCVAAVKEEREQTMSTSLRRLKSYEEFDTDATAFRQGNGDVEEKLPKPARLVKLHVLAPSVREREGRKEERK